MSVFRTARLELRPFDVSDAGDIVALLNDPDVCRGLAVVPYPYALSDAHEFIARRTEEAFAVCRKDGTFLGTVGLGAQLGYWFGKTQWGKGYATEAATAVLADHFAHSDAPVLSGYAAWNSGSANVLAKLGFKITGEKMLHIRSLDKEVPAKSVTLTKADWEARA